LERYGTWHGFEQIAMLDVLLQLQLTILGEELNASDDAYRLRSGVN